MLQIPRGGIVAETLQIPEQQQAAVWRPRRTTKVAGSQAGSPEWPAGHEGQRVLGKEQHGG